MPPAYPNRDQEDPAPLARALAKLEAAELELDRAHRLLDTWGVPRELPTPGQRPQDLSLTGRLNLLSD